MRAALLLAPIGAAAAALAAYYEARARAGAEERREMLRLAAFLHSLYLELRYGKRTLYSCLSRSCASLESDSAMLRTIRRAMRMVELGCGFDEALRAACASQSSGACRVLLSIAAEYGATGMLASAVRNAYDTLRADARRAGAAARGTLERYVSIGMVSSTVVPSMALFGFIGYAIMGQGAIALPAIVALLLYVLPCCHAAITSKVWEYALPA